MLGLCQAAMEKGARVQLRGQSRLAPAATHRCIMKHCHLPMQSRHRYVASHLCSGLAHGHQGPLPQQESHVQSMHRASDCLLFKKPTLPAALLCCERDRIGGLDSQQEWNSYGSMSSQQLLVGIPCT